MKSKAEIEDLLSNKTKACCDRFVFEQCHPRNPWQPPGKEVNFEEAHRCPKCSTLLQVTFHADQKNPIGFTQATYDPDHPE